MGKVIVGFTASATVATLGLTSAFAATTSFDSQYQANSNTEQSLLDQVSSSSTNTTVTDLLSTVNSINTEVSALYSAEQALASAKSSIPQLHTLGDNVKKIDLKREQILKKSNVAWKLVGKCGNQSNDKQSLEKAIKDRAGIEKQLLQADRKITAINTNSNAYNGALKSLQNAILKLQASAIHYTKEVISLEKSTTSSTTSSSNSNSSSSVTVTPTN
jgi:hypothetical protein